MTRVKALHAAAEALFGEDPNCIVCGRDVARAEYGLCGACLEAFPFDQPPLIKKCLSVATYETPVKQLIYDYKYNDKRYLGRYMAALMAAVIQREGLAFDLVLTVPSSLRRKKIRGFDHTLYMAQVLSDNLSISCGSHYLERVKETERLKGLSKAERLKELAGAFAVSDKGALRGKKLLLIDDILTTGATLSACTEVLNTSGCESICWLTFARVV